MTQHYSKLGPSEAQAGASGIPPREYVLKVEQTVSAPRPDVWAVWTSNEYWATSFEGRHIEMLDPQFDIRDGGSFRHGIVSLGMEVWFHGRYLTVQAPELMVFTHVWETQNHSDDTQTQISVHLHDSDGRTRIELAQGPFADHSAHDLYEEFWTSSLQRFAKLFDDPSKTAAGLPHREPAPKP